jgi:AraC-like DNA-binding protein
MMEASQSGPGSDAMGASPSKSDVIIWRDASLDAELLRGQFHDFSYDVHTHETACLALITQGAIRIRMKGSEFIARQGDLYAIEADEPHAGWPVDDQGWRQRTLYVDTASLRARQESRRKPATSTLRGPIIRDPELTALFRGVHRCSEVRGDALLREEHYQAFGTRLFERHVREPQIPSTVGPESHAIRRAKEFLDHHLDGSVHLADIAQAAGLPPFRLFRAFERHAGMTPHGYQRQARMRTATRLIRQGHALSEAAAIAGYADQAHLTRCFRRALGVTPGAYQKAVRA